MGFRNRLVYEFATADGKEITTALGHFCQAIVSDIETKKSDQRALEKEKEWDSYWRDKEAKVSDCLLVCSTFCVGWAL